MSGWTADISSDGRLHPSLHRPAETSHQIDSGGYSSRGVGLGVAQDASYAEPAQGPGQPSAIRGPVRSTGFTTNAPQPADLSPVDYTIVPESKSPHHTPSTAQSLPDLPYFGVIGTTATGDAIDLYRLTLNDGAGRLEFSLVSTEVGQTAPVQFQIFDGSGHLLGAWSSGGQGSRLWKPN